MQLQIKKQVWSEAAIQGLGETLGNDGDILENQVRTGIAELWCINGTSWMITRVETLPKRKPELVVCCFKGRDLKPISDAIVQAAKTQGLGSIRFHTQRKGLHRLLRHLNFEFVETVYSKTLEGNTWVENPSLQTPPA